MSTGILVLISQVTHLHATSNLLRVAIYLSIKDSDGSNLSAADQHQVDLIRQSIRSFHHAPILQPKPNTSGHPSPPLPLQLQVPRQP